MLIYLRSLKNYVLVYTTSNINLKGRRRHDMVYRFFHQQTTRRHDTDQAEAVDVTMLRATKGDDRRDEGISVPGYLRRLCIRPSPSAAALVSMPASRPDDARARTAHQHQLTSAATLHLNRSGDPLRTPTFAIFVARTPSASGRAATKSKRKPIDLHLLAVDGSLPPSQHTMQYPPGVGVLQ
jgi:hypothetical protein